MLLPPAHLQALRSFLCNHFDAAELMHLARGIWVEQPLLLHSLPPAGTALAPLVDIFIDTAQRHGFIDEEFFRALAAARPRLRYTIRKLQDDSGVEETPSAASSSGRLRLRLELDFESLTADRIEGILALLRTITGDARMTIESISKGSVIFVLKGADDALAELDRRFSAGTLEHLNGIRVIEVERVKVERSKLGDIDLLSRWRAGDKRSGDDLFWRHYDCIAGFFLRNVYHNDEIALLINETFATLLRSTDDIANVHWELYRIAFARFAHFLRRCKGRASDSGDDPGDTREYVAGDLTPDPEYILGQRDETRLLMRAIRRLPLWQQQVLELSIWENKSGSEIAAILAVAGGTAFSRLRLARKSLSKKLAELADSEEALRDTAMKVNEWRARVQADQDQEPEQEPDQDLKPSGGQ